MTSPAPRYPNANASEPRLGIDIDRVEDTGEESNLNSPVESEEYEETPSEPITRQNSSATPGLGLGGTPAYLQFTPRRVSLFLGVLLWLW